FALTSTAPSHLRTLSLHDALPISGRAPISTACRPGYSLRRRRRRNCQAIRSIIFPLPAREWNAWKSPDAFASWPAREFLSIGLRSEEHTSELQSRVDLVCRLLLEK